MKNRVAELRKAKGLSQGELGQAIGVTQTIISRIEIGKQSLSDETMLQLATELDVHPVELIDDPRWNKIPFTKLDDALFRFISKVVIGLAKRHPTITDDMAAEVMSSLYRRYAAQASTVKSQFKNIEEAANILIGHELNRNH